jgi:hypothetical protein
MPLGRRMARATGSAEVSTSTLRSKEEASDDPNGQAHSEDVTEPVG